MNAYERLRHELESYLSYLDKPEIDKLCVQAWNALSFVNLPHELSQGEIEIYARCFARTFEIGRDYEFKIKLQNAVK